MIISSIFSTWRPKMELNRIELHWSLSIVDNFSLIDNLSWTNLCSSVQSYILIVGYTCIVYRVALTKKSNEMLPASLRLSETLNLSYFWELSGPAIVGTIWQNRLQIPLEHAWSTKSQNCISSINDAFKNKFLTSLCSSFLVHFLPLARSEFSRGPHVSKFLSFDFDLCVWMEGEASLPLLPLKHFFTCSTCVCAGCSMAVCPFCHICHKMLFPLLLGGILFGGELCCAFALPQLPRIVSRV